MFHILIKTKFIHDFFLHEERSNEIEPSPNRKVSLIRTIQGNGSELSNLRSRGPIYDPLRRKRERERE